MKVQVLINGEEHLMVNLCDKVPYFATRLNGLHVKLSLLCPECGGDGYEYTTAFGVRGGRCPVCVGSGIDRV